ncbi:MAG TPA: Spy/CpxP family protein refolding chaperone [Pyrinomonadaceae bacterium]|nr:Spy/CpxP family protein refolding chaperone [Pyrinomonadaceae bacterium]HMP65982.1 Spy/CpxP family protein refolding chaperone [Pyrinomonadaceae bacterium]
MKKIVAIMMAVVLVAMGAIFVIGQTSEGPKREGWGGKKGMKRGGKMHRGGGMMFRGLDLTDAQKEQIKAFREASKPALQPLMEAMKINRQNLREARANNADEATVNALLAERRQFSVQMRAFRQSMHQQTLAILTDEQKAKLQEMKQKRTERFQNRGQGRRGGKGNGETQL